MDKKAQGLQGALKNVQKSTVDKVTTAPSTGGYMAPSREGKVNITAYLSPAFKSSLRLIQARRQVSLQALIAEALNDLFVKHNVPTVRDD